ncbi:hypothetical protein, partial [Desertibacillus haloalkaliphilus]
GMGFTLLNLYQILSILGITIGWDYILFLRRKKFKEKITTESGEVPTLVIEAGKSGHRFSFGLLGITSQSIYYFEKKKLFKFPISDIENIATGSEGTGEFIGMSQHVAGGFS